MTRPFRFVPQAESLDARVVPAVDFGNGTFLTGPSGTETFAVAPASGSSLVQVFNTDGSRRFSFPAYDAGFTGGAFVGTGDVTGDRVEDIVTSTGPSGSANVRVFDGRTGDLITSFLAYPVAFTGGANVAVGDVDGDGFADIISGVGAGGGPNVRVFNGRRLLQNDDPLTPFRDGGALMNSFFAYDQGFTGGVRVAAGDTDGDRFDDVITGVGSGGGPNVRVLDGRQLGRGNVSLASVGAGGVLRNSFFALPELFTGGTFVGSGDVNGDGIADVIVGVGNGGGPNVRAFDGRTSSQLGSFFAFDDTLTGGVRVAGNDFDNDGFDDFVVGTGPGTGGQLRGFSGRDAFAQQGAQFSPFSGFSQSSQFNGGVNIG